jgi:chorismate synthase
VLRFLTAGESHGRALVVIVEGLPAGLPVEASDIAAELARRRLGYGRGPRMRFEADEISLVGGIRHGRTLGSPVAIEIANTEWPKWTEEMSPEPGAPSKVLTQPRSPRGGRHPRQAAADPPRGLHRESHHRPG